MRSCRISETLTINKCIDGHQDSTTASILRACGDVCRTLILGMGRDDGRDINNGNYHLGNNTLVSHILTRWPKNYADNTREQNIEWLVADLSAQLAQRQGPGPWFIQVLSAFFCDRQQAYQSSFCQRFSKKERAWNFRDLEMIVIEKNPCFQSPTSQF